MQATHAGTPSISGANLLYKSSIYFSFGLNANTTFYSWFGIYKAISNTIDIKNTDGFSIVRIA